MTCTAGQPVRLPHIACRTSAPRLDPPMPSSTTSLIPSSRTAAAKSVKSATATRISCGQSSQPSRLAISSGESLHTVKSRSRIRVSTRSRLRLSRVCSSSGQFLTFVIADHSSYMTCGAWRIIAPMPQVRIGADTGGTFTDILLDPGDGGPLLRHKLPSTPGDPSRAVRQGVDAVLGQLRAADNSERMVIHGSTVATNALLEGKGARAAFVTTAGFEDIVFLARQNRPELYQLEVRKPDPPLDPADCHGLRERIGADGSVLEPLAKSDIEELLVRLGESGVKACCICLLHSYANPQHEQAVAEAIRGQLPDLHLTVSSELLPEFREYERAATCLANAVVGPVMDGYIARLSRGLKGDQLRIMASNGGSLPVETVLRAPVQTILSGPAGGVRGAMLSAGA
ncbi:MAG TPA: hydantoinase/oxoprolinase family protein, partial [Firmicutes bacterium]|nr:hydantoinase/oxoprolinase family protein [Bacillota bacterium]